MRRSLVLGVVLAVFASAITSAGLLMASGPGDPPKGSTPDKALAPDEVTKLPEGQLATSLKLPYDYGRFASQIRQASTSIASTSPVGNVPIS